jgi:TetR/AcrR family transcriptional regulator, ethionamide resistance regulator
VAAREDHSAVRRRRRTPEAAQREIIEAAERLLHERPFRELTVDEVMRRTGLSRPSFYVYFRDRHDLVLRVVEHVGRELFQRADIWLGISGAGPDGVRRGMEGVVEVYGQHAAALRALADAAADDPDVEQAYGALIQGFVDSTAERIAAEMRAGIIAPELDAAEISKALTWMCERYLYNAFAPDRRVPHDRVVETLSQILTRVLYQS